MKKLLAIVPVLALLGAGCIQIDQKLVLNNDASGTLEIKYSVPDETSQRIKAMLKLAGQLADAGGNALTPTLSDDFTPLLFDPQESALRKRIASYAPLGMHLEELEVKAQNARRDVKFTISFTNIANVAKADFFPYYGFTLAKSSTGAYVWFTRPTTREQIDPEWEADSQDADKLTSPLLRGFHFGLDIQTPGTVLKTNAERHTPYTAHWSYDFDIDHDALAKLQREQMTVVFDSKDLHLPEFKQPEPPPTPERTASTNAPAAAPKSVVGH